MTSKRNVLFIMCDQLRFDYLSCAGHKSLKTPNIDRLASRGVRFTNAYVQSTVCGPSRMSAYTGRYVRSHGSTHNGVPLRVGEPTLGDHLREVGVRTALIGKTHMRADEEGMARLGIARDSIIGVRVAECGFEPFERDDGLHPSTSDDPDPATAICASTASTPKIHGSIGRIPAKARMVRISTAGCSSMPTSRRAFRTSIPKRPT